MADLSAATNMDPKRLLLIVGGGVAIGLGWRYWNKRNGGAAVPSTVDTAQQDLLNTGFSTVGAGAGSGTGSGSNDRRDTVANGTLPLPIVSYLVRDDNGALYQVTGDSFTPLSDVIAPTPAPVPNPPAVTLPGGN